MFRYATVSVISTIVSFSVLGIVFGVFRLWIGGAEHRLRQPGGQRARRTTSTAPGSWGKSGRSHVFKEVVPFWTMTAIGITMSIGTASLARHIEQRLRPPPLRADRGGRGRQHRRPSPCLWIVKFLVFNRLFHVDPVAELDEQLTSRRRRRPSPSRRAPGTRCRSRLTACGQSLKFWNCRGMPKSCSLQRLDHRLEVVALLARDPELVALGLRRHALQVQVLDELVESSWRDRRRCRP